MSRIRCHTCKTPALFAVTENTTTGTDGETEYTCVKHLADTVGSMTDAPEATVTVANLRYTDR